MSPEIKKIALNLLPTHYPVVVSSGIMGATIYKSRIELLKRIINEDYEGMWVNDTDANDLYIYDEEYEEIYDHNGVPVTSEGVYVMPLKDLA
jgi:nitrate reductase alpha subunit